MKLKNNFDENMDIELRAKMARKTYDCKEEANPNKIIDQMPVLEKKLDKLYKLTGKHYNEILKNFMRAFIYLDNTDDEFYNFIFEYRKVMFPKYKNISYDVAHYVLSSTDTEVVYLNEGLQILCEYFEWQNKNRNCGILRNYTDKDKEFVAHCGYKILNAFPTTACVAFPQQYIMGGGDARVANMQKVLGDKKLTKFKNDLKDLSDACAKLQEIKNVKHVIDPKQSTLEDFSR